MKTLIVIRTADPHRQSEALRGALGVTLRGAAVEVVVDEPLHTPLAQRAADTLRAFGHAVGPGEDLRAKLARADVVEVWTMTALPTAQAAAGTAASPTTSPGMSPARGSSPARPRGRVLHLARSEPPAGVVAEDDWVVYLEAMRLASSGEPPLPAGLIDHDQLVQLSFAADLVVHW